MRQHHRLVDTILELLLDRCEAFAVRYECAKVRAQRWVLTRARVCMMRSLKDPCVVRVFDLRDAQHLHNL